MNTDDFDHAKEKTVKIANPERIDRVLTKICGARLEALIRLPGQKGLAIKGKCASVDGLQILSPQFHINDISAQGMLHLKNVKEVRIEFVGMATQVLFETTITSFGNQSIAVKKPLELLSLERRENARYQATQEHAAFLILSTWKPVVLEYTSPPVMPPFANLAGWIPIADISAGGFCASTRFPSVLNAVQRGAIDDRAYVVFPMQKRLPIKVEVRWLKRLKERITEVGQERFAKSFRFGLQFIEPSDELNLAVKQFVQQVTLAQAV